MYNSQTLQGGRHRRHGTVRPMGGGLSGTNSLELIIENDNSSWGPHLEKLESVETVLSHIEFDSP